MIYELRIYRVMNGRMADLLARFEHHTLPIMARYGFLQVGFWTTIVGRSEQHLTYLLAWESLAQRQEQWDALAALRAAKLLVPENSEIDLFQLDGIPMFNEDDEKRPPSSVLELKKRIRSANSVLIVTPEYNYSIPGVLKNALDWACRPHGDSAWSGKPAAIMGASLGAIGTARAQYHLRQIFCNSQLVSSQSA